MSPSAGPSTVQSTDALRLQMERSIDELASAVHSDIEPGQFFGEVLRRALQAGGAVHATLWRISLEGTWEIAGQLPSGGTIQSMPSLEMQQILGDIAQSNQARMTGPVTLPGDAHATTLRFFSPLHHSGQTVGILETRHATGPSENLPPTTHQFFAAMGEITGDFLSQLELKRLRQARLLWHQWDQYSQRLAQSLEVADVCTVIANDGRQVLGCDRISVLVKQGTSYRLRATSGVERQNARAGAVRSLESLAGLVAQNRLAIWCDVPEVSMMPKDDMDQVIQRHGQESGAIHIGAIPIVSEPGAPSASSIAAVIVLEQFQTMPNWSAEKPRAESLAERSENILRAALEHDSIPWIGLWRRLQRGPRRLRRPASLISLAILLAGIASLVLIPAELTVTGHGELWPDRRRDVFASTSGIVDRILVDHGDDVRNDQPVLVLRDPQLEQEIPKNIGEVATLYERLKGIQTVRLTSATSESIAKLRQLTADEEELKERLKTLELQRKLLDERQAALTLRSSITGKVLTWDVTQHLSARPVDRGQSLLTVGETDGPWIVEIRVADKDAGHVLRARQSKLELDVDFLLAAEPGRTYHGNIRSVSLTTESDEQSSGFVRVIVEFDRGQIDQLRPGATAIPRIRCGRHSLGYVWFHDLIDALRTRVLF